MLVKKLLVIAVIIIVSHQKSFAFNRNPDAANGLLKVYGYIIGQERTLDQIEKAFPELRQKVQLARLEFKLTYGDVTQSVTSIISSLFPELQEKIALVVYEQAKNIDAPSLTKSSAEDYVTKVQNRANGTIESIDLKRYLFAVAYFDRPEREFARFRDEYDFTNDSKSKGLNLKVQVPQSWLASDSRFPNTLKTWRTGAGTGKGFSNLEVHRYDGPEMDSDYVKKLLSQGEIPRVALPKNATVSDIKLTEFSGLPAVMYSFNLSTDRIGVTLHQRHSVLVIYTKDRTIIMNCAVGGLGSEQSQLILIAQKYQNLCFLYFNSLIIS